MKRVTKKRVKSKLSKKIIIIFFVLIVFFSIFAIRQFSKIKKIDIIISIEDDDMRKITKEDVKKYSNINIGDRLYEKLRSQIVESIEQNSYIEKAIVTRSISGIVKIEVTQRSPKYLINYAGEYIYIDKEGYVLEVNSQNNGNPIILGIATDFTELSIGNTKLRLNEDDIEKIQIVNDIILAIKSNDIQNKITSIDITNKRNFILNLEDDGKTVYIGDGTDLNTRVLYMKKILEKETGNNGEIYVNGDLDEGYVYFKEQ